MLISFHFPCAFEVTHTKTKCVNNDKNIHLTKLLSSIIDSFSPGKKTTILCLFRLRLINKPNLAISECFNVSMIQTGDGRIKGLDTFGAVIIELLLFTFFSVNKE